MLSDRLRLTVTISPAPNCPDSETVYCAVVPSSAKVVPVIDHTAGPSAAPPGPCVSLMTVMTSSAAVSMAIAAPVEVAALVSASVKSSGPSKMTSSAITRLMIKSAIIAPSDGAV